MIFFKWIQNPKVAKHFLTKKIDDSSIERENAINEDKANDTNIFDLQGSSEAKEEHKESYFSSPKYNIANQKQILTHYFSNSLMPLTWSNQML